MLRVLRSDLWFCLAFVAGGVLLFEPTPTQRQIGEYLSFLTTKIGYSDFEGPDHRRFQSDIASELPVKSRTSVEFSYIKFDRKQNTRLWPFIFTGITRSPPVSH
jgi:hypothetical protein